MESEFAVESSVRGTTSTKSLGEELPCEWYAVAVMRVHNLPNRQIKFPAKFSGHTVIRPTPPILKLPLWRKGQVIMV